MNSLSPISPNKTALPFSQCIATENRESLCERVWTMVNEPTFNQDELIKLIKQIQGNPQTTTQQDPLLFFLLKKMLSTENSFHSLISQILNLIISCNRHQLEYIDSEGNTLWHLLFRSLFWPWPINSQHVNSQCINKTPLGLPFHLIPLSLLEHSNQDGHTPYDVLLSSIRTAFSHLQGHENLDSLHYFIHSLPKKEGILQYLFDIYQEYKRREGEIPPILLPRYKRVTQLLINFLTKFQTLLFWDYFFNHDPHTANDECLKSCKILTLKDTPFKNLSLKCPFLFYFIQELSIRKQGMECSNKEKQRMHHIYDLFSHQLNEKDEKGYTIFSYLFKNRLKDLCTIFFNRTLTPFPFSAITDETLKDTITHNQYPLILLFESIQKAFSEPANQSGIENLDVFFLEHWEDIEWTAFELAKRAVSNQHPLIIAPDIYQSIFIWESENKFPKACALIKSLLNMIECEAKFIVNIYSPDVRVEEAQAACWQEMKLYFNQSIPRSFFDLLKKVINLGPNSQGQTFLMYVLAQHEKLSSKEELESLYYYPAQKIEPGPELSYRPNAKIFLSIYQLSKEKNQFNQTDQDGNTILHLILKSQFFYIYTSREKGRILYFSLLDFLFSIHVKNKAGETPLDLLIQQFIYAPDHYLSQTMDAQASTKNASNLIIEMTNRGAQISPKTMQQLHALQNGTGSLHNQIKKSPVFSKFLTLLNVRTRLSLTNPQPTQPMELTELLVGSKLIPRSLLQNLVISSLPSSFISEPNYLVRNLRKFPTQQVIKYYSQLVAQIQAFWNQQDIQVNLLRLIGEANGHRQIDLARALQQGGELDSRGIAYILKPFYDFYGQIKEQVLAQAIIQDAIQSLRLCFTGKNKEDLVQGLNLQFPTQEKYSTFILSLLLHNTKRAEDFQKFAKTQAIELISHNQPNNIPIATTMRNLFFYCSLKELAARALNLASIIKEHLSPPSSLSTKPAILLYSVKNKHFISLLTIIQELPSHSLQMMGLKNEHPHPLIEKILPHRQDSLDQSFSAHELESIQDYYYKYPKEFYLFSPLSSSCLNTHQDPLPPLNSPQLSISKAKQLPSCIEINTSTRNTKKRPSQKEEERKKISKIPKITLVSQENAPYQTSSINPQRIETPISHLPYKPITIFHDSFNLLNPPPATDAVGHDNQNNSTQKRRKIDSQSYTPTLGHYQPSINTTAHSTLPPPKRALKEKETAFYDLERTLLADSSTTTIQPAGEITLDILSSLCQKTIDRIKQIVQFNKFDQLEELLATTKDLVTSLSQMEDPSTLLKAIQFDDKELKNYQKEMVAWALSLFKQQVGGMIAAAPGLGKTKIACEIIRQIHKVFKADQPILICVPNGLLPQWHKTLLDLNFTIRKEYYLTLIQAYEQLDARQREQLKQAIHTLFVSQYKQIEKTLTEIDKTHIKQNALEKELKEKKDLAKNQKKLLKKYQQKILELRCEQDVLIQRLKESGLLIQQCLFIPGFGIDLFTLLFHTLDYNPSCSDLIKTSFEIWIESYTQHIQHACTSASFEQALHHLTHPVFIKCKKYSFENHFKTKDQVQQTLFNLLSLTSNSPIQLNQFKLFILTLTNQKEVAPPLSPTLSLDDSLIANDMYEQVIIFSSSQKHLPSYQAEDPRTKWKIILTYPNALISSHSYLENRKDLVWSALFMDEAHEWGWDMTQPGKLDTLKEKKTIKTILDSIDAQKYLLSGTPLVNRLGEMLSYIQMLNPKIPMDKLAKIVHNRKVLLQDILRQAIHHSIQEKEDLFLNDQSALTKALANWLIVMEHIRVVILQQLVKIRTMDEELVQNDWTFQDTVLLPPLREVNLPPRPLTPAQQERFILTGNPLKDDETTSRLFFHPFLLDTEWKNASEAEIKTRILKMKNQDQGRELDAFVEQSTFLRFILKEDPIRTEINKGTHIGIFLPQIKFGIILKVLFSHYFPHFKVKLYNGRQHRDERARIVNTFESGNDSIQGLILTPEAGGMGLNLRSAKILINGCYIGWHDTFYEQMIARIRRPGDAEERVVYNLCHDTIIELFKSLTVTRKNKWKKALLSSEPTRETLTYAVDALISDSWNISLQDTITVEEVKKEAAQIETRIRQILHDSLTHIIEYLDMPHSPFATQLKQATEMTSMAYK